MALIPAYSRPPPNLPDEMIAEDLAEMCRDPLAFIRYAYTWGSGDLENFAGPDPWQAGFFRELGEEMRLRNFDGRTPVMPILTSTVSGHGVGKTATVGMASDFIRSCWPQSRGRVLANTGAQLSTITWAEILKWGKRSITAHWWKFGARSIGHKQNLEGWKVDAIVWDEHKPETVAGLHAATSVPYYIFDEASRIPRIIMETAQGALTDGAPIMMLFGNGTRNSGYFYETHNKNKNRWVRFKVDSRKARVSNKQLLRQWIDDEGIDSDFVKIRVLGDFPNQSSAQFISTKSVELAMKREIQGPNITDPIIIGVDCARGGDKSVIVIRKGRDCRSYPVWRKAERNTMAFVGVISKLIEKHQPDAVFVDETGLGGPIVDRLLQLNMPNVFGVNFGYASPDRSYHRLVDYMWGMMRNAIEDGLALPDHDDLKSELTVRETGYDANNAYQLESKDDLAARGEASPDWADAIALTFASPVGPRSIEKTEAAFTGKRQGNQGIGVDHDPH